MATSFDELLPRIEETRTRYRRSANEAFIGVEPKICGKIEVLPFTPRMFLELETAGNRFLTGSEHPQIEDILSLLWRVCPLYSTDSVARRDFVLIVPFVLHPYTESQIASQVCEYVRRAWEGMPLFRSTAGSEVGVGSWISRLIHTFAKNYGWTEEYILNLPFRRAWQYMNRILEDENPKYRELCAEELAIRDEWLRQQNQNN